MPSLMTTSAHQVIGSGHLHRYAAVAEIVQADDPLFAVSAFEGEHRAVGVMQETKVAQGQDGLRFVDGDELMDEIQQGGRVR